MDDTGIKIYSKYNEEESSLAERFIRTLDTKIYKHITAVSENGFINVLDEIVYKYNKTYHRTFKLRPNDVKGDTYIDHDVEHNDKYLKFKVGGHVGIPNNKNNFARSYTPNWSEKVFVIKKVKITVP